MENDQGVLVSIGGWNEILESNKTRIDKTNDQENPDP